MNDYGKRVDKTTVRFERDLPGPIERVWAYLVEPEKRMKWFCAGETELKPGGKAEFHFDHRRITDDKPPKKYEQHGGEIKFEGTVVEADPPRLFVFDWPEETGESTRVRIELKPVGEKVRLTLTHSMLEKRETMISVSGGWHIHLDLLEAILAGKQKPKFWESIVRFEEEYEKRHGA
ncbi:MAG: SRPBCC family protein [Pseudomonadota bacterium]|nr:SRPBCC family protein [Pseudomonadota bacterium]